MELLIARDLMQLLLDEARSLSLQLLRCRQEGCISSRTDTGLLCSVSFPVVLVIAYSISRKSVQGVVLVLAVDPFADGIFHFALCGVIASEERMIEDVEQFLHQTARIHTRIVPSLDHILHYVSDNDYSDLSSWLVQDTVEMVFSQ